MADIGKPIKRVRTYPLTEPVPDDVKEPKTTPAPVKEPEKVPAAYGLISSAVRASLMARSARQRRLLAIARGQPCAKTLHAIERFKAEPSDETWRNAQKLLAKRMPLP